MRGYHKKAWRLLASLLFASFVALCWRQVSDGAEPGPAQALPGGIPRAQAHSFNTWIRVFDNDGFSVGYSEWRRNPLWVAYPLRPVSLRKPYRRPARFEVDPRSLVRVAPADYTRSGYQRGHLAPSWLIAQLHGRKAQEQTFLMTNIAPQTPNLNQKLWQRLEMVEADHFARWFGALWVQMGPIFDGHIERLPSGVEVPDGFYRIYLAAQADGAIEVLAFVVPQAVRGDEPLEQFVVTVDDIEQRTGLDFMSQLEDKLEQQLEAGQPRLDYWRLHEVSRIPSRY